ncbi:MAG: alkaline phosphatase, partial [Bradymonadaceae bacterium]
MLTMDRLNYITTHSYEYVTTDSAASATAFATGQKTHYQGVSVKPGTTKEQENNEKYHLKTTLEQAEDRGWKTGLVATSRIVHATPAAFAAHRANRNSDKAIARDMAQSGVDVLLGGGRKYFNDRSDGQNLWAGFEKDGYQLAESADQLQSAFGVADRLVGLFHRDDPPGIGSEGGRAMSLPKLTEGAIEVLDRNNDEGFFLMVEGSQIDWEAHDLDSAIMDGPQRASRFDGSYFAVPIDI